MPEGFTAGTEAYCHLFVMEITLFSSHPLNPNHRFVDFAARSLLACESWLIA